MSKKINFLRAGAFTMVLALGTTCFMSGTLAKYVTSGEGSDSARVAKFGVKVTATGETFAKSYDEEDTLELKTVLSSDNAKLVAPGTKGNMAAISITGEPEVAIEVSYDEVAFDLSPNWINEKGKFYCPLIITIGEDTEKVIIDGSTFDTASAFEKKVEDTIKSYKDEYYPTTGFDNIATPSVSWEWPFYISDEKDVSDTYLGDQAAEGNPATVLLNMKVKVTQID